MCAIIRLMPCKVFVQAFPHLLFQQGKWVKDGDVLYFSTQPWADWKCLHEKCLADDLVHALIYCTKYNTIIVYISRNVICYLPAYLPAYNIHSNSNQFEVLFEWVLSTEQHTQTHHVISKWFWELKEVNLHTYTNRWQQWISCIPNHLEIRV